MTYTNSPFNPAFVRRSLFGGYTNTTYVVTTFVLSAVLVYLTLFIIPALFILLYGVFRTIYDGTKLIARGVRFWQTRNLLR